MDDRADAGNVSSGSHEPTYRRREVITAGAKIATGAALLPMLGASPALAKARSKLGLVGTDHVGLTVPNIAEVVAWFKDVMGAAAPLSFGPMAAIRRAR